MVKLAELNEEEKFALLYGIMLGDGCLSLHRNKKNKKYYFISVSGNYYDDQDFFREIVIPLFTHFRKKEIKLRQRPKLGKIELNFNDKKLFNLIHSYGFPIGKKGPRLYIPKIFYEKKYMKYIIQGFFATDGCLSITRNNIYFYPRIVIKTIHKYAMRQMMAIHYLWV